MSATQANIAEFQDGGMPVAPPVYLVDYAGNPIVSQASQNASVGAGAGTSAKVIKSSAGFLSGVVVTANASAAMSIYDNPAAASGTVIGYIPATATAGQYYPFNMPARTGITVGIVSGSAGITVAYS